MFGIINATAKNVLVQGIIQKHLLIYAEKYFKGKLIDIGCGTKPYQDIFSPYTDEHIGVDRKESFHDQKNVDIFGTAYHIPVDNESFDSALCSAVLEHLEEPEMAIRECFRVLKINGFAIYSIPFIWHLHEEPRDFYRYSKYGIRYLFEKAGFEIVELEALSGFWVTFGQLFVYNIYRFNRGPFRWFGIVAFFGLLLQGIVYLMDKFDKTEKWTWMYMVVAKKSG